MFCFVFSFNSLSNILQFRTLDALSLGEQRRHQRSGGRAGQPVLFEHRLHSQELGREGIGMALSSRDARMWEPDDELTAEALSRPEEGRLAKPASAIDSSVSTCSRHHSGCHHGPQVSVSSSVTEDNTVSRDITRMEWGSRSVNVLATNLFFVGVTLEMTPEGELEQDKRWRIWVRVLYPGNSTRQDHNAV